MTYWDEKDRRHGKRKKHPVPVQLNRVELARENSKAKSKGCRDPVPPEGHSLIRRLRVVPRNMLMAHQSGELRTSICVYDTVAFF